jgi:hypothetical protein
MSDWTIFYRDLNRRDLESPKLASKERAFARARDLHRQHFEIDRIQGPNNEVIHREEILEWIKQNPE